MNKRIAGILAAALVLAVMPAGCAGGGDGIATERVPPVDTQSGTTPGETVSGEAASEETTSGEAAPEEQKPKSVSSCFYVKDNRLFYIDNINRTPIPLVDELYTGSYEDAGDVTGRVNDVLRRCFHKNYDDLGLVLYCDRGNSGDYIYDGHFTDDLCLRDVSSPEGETVHIADNVANDFTYLVPDEMAVYYTVMLSDTAIIDETSCQRYRYDIQTGKSAPWEQGEFNTGTAYGDELCEIWYGLGTARSKDITICEYATGEKYYYRYMTEDRSVMNLYYWDGSGEHLVREMEHGSFTETKCRERNLIAIENGCSRATVVVKDKAFDINPLFAEGSQVFEVVFDAEGDTGYCAVFQTRQGGDQGLYKFAIYEDSIGPMELIDPDIATVDPATYGARVCWVSGGDVFYTHKDRSLYCNGTLIDPSGQINKIFFFYDGQLCYAANMARPDGSFSYDMPYTFKAANGHGCCVLNDSVIKYRMNRSLWYLGDYGCDRTGALYLAEDGECIRIEADVCMID